MRYRKRTYHAKQGAQVVRLTFAVPTLGVSEEPNRKQERKRAPQAEESGTPPLHPLMTLAGHLASRSVDDQVDW